MQIYDIKDFYGVYESSTSPNTYTSSLGINLIFKTRKTPKPGQPKHYLMYQKPNCKPQYFSALWGRGEVYTISDTQRKRALCSLEPGCLNIIAK